MADPKKVNKIEVILFLEGR